jgi:hypothetical protein
LGKFPDTVNGPHKVDSWDKVKQSQDVNADVDLMGFSKLVKDSH